MENMVVDIVAFRQNEADNSLQRFEIIKKNVEYVKKNIAEVEEKNVQVDKAKGEI